MAQITIKIKRTIQTTDNKLLLDYIITSMNVDNDIMQALYSYYITGESYVYCETDNGQELRAINNSVEIML